MLPVSEAKSVVVWSTAKINNESHDQQTNDGDDLDGSEDKFGFTVDLDGENVQADDESDDESDPDCDTDVIRTLPVLDDDGGSRDFGTESNCRIVPVLFEEGK